MTLKAFVNGVGEKRLRAALNVDERIVDPCGEPHNRGTRVLITAPRVGEPERNF